MPRLSSFLFLLVAVATFAACSSNMQNPTIPTEKKTEFNLPVDATNQWQTGRDFLGAWTVEFAPETLELSIIPSREILAHMNITTLIPTPTYNVISFDPLQGILYVDVTIRNPYNLDGYDLRMIVYTDNMGNRLLNPDDWTPLYDIAGGSQINPFKAYAKGQTYRKFAGYSQHTERLELYFPSGFTSLNFAIDVSYPGNCDEPYEIRDFTQNVLYDGLYYSTPISIKVYDWQNDTNSVQLYCPIITSVTLLPLTQINSFTWGTTLVNYNAVSAGKYTGYIVATSANSGTLALYDSVSITVSALNRNGWVRTWGGTSNDWGYDLAIDSWQNILVTGFFNGVVDFDPGPMTVQYDSGGDIDIYLSKFDPNGLLDWARAWDIGYANYGMSVAADPTGIYITGGGVSIRKYDHNGNIIREHYWGGYGTDICYNLDTDSSDNFYSVGIFEDTVDFDPGTGIDQHTSNGNQDAFVSKLDPNGNYVYAKTWGGASNDTANDLIFDSYGNFYVTGVFRGTVDFDPGTGVLQYTDAGFPYGQGDPYLSRFDSNGNFSGVYTWGGLMYETGNDLAADGSGNVYVAGAFTGICDFYPGSMTLNITSLGGDDAYFSKFNAYGGFSWVMTWGGTDYDRAYTIEIDPVGNIYVAGTFENTVDFDPGTGSVQLTSNGNSDIFLSKFDSSGYHVWTRAWGGTNYDLGYDLMIDKSGNVYLTGYYMGTVDFDPGTGVQNHTANGENDVFLIKLLPNGYWQ